jgi:hypothetical protein
MNQSMSQSESGCIPGKRFHFQLMTKPVKSFDIDLLVKNLLSGLTMLPFVYQKERLIPELHRSRGSL